MAKNNIESIINTKNIKQADVIILSAAYGRSFTYRAGAEKGPREIINCLHGNLEFFDRFLRKEPFREINICHHEIKGLNNMSTEQMVKAVSNFYLKFKDKFILMIGGDHSVSIGAFYHLFKNDKPKGITILQIDAHPDLRDNTLDYQKTSNKYSHACVMRRASEFGFNIVQVGIRTFSIYDYEFTKSKKIKVFEWGKGKTPTIRSIINAIKTKKVYLSFDIDGLDPAHAPATGTPVPGGLEWYYARKLIKELILVKNLIGADIVEVSPKKNDVLTQYSAAQLCYDILSYKILKEKEKLKFYD